MGQASALNLPFHLLRSMRPRQWLKNLLLFAGIIFSHNYGHFDLLGRAVAGFSLFCLLSGSVYILNDLQDVEADRLHPVKRKRPIASGAVSPGLARSFAMIGALVALGGGFCLSVAFGVVALLYFLLTLSYSFYFKHVAIVDILLLALGFVLRSVAGVFVIRVPDGPFVPLTPWFIVCVLFLALFIAICKRRSELVNLGEAGECRNVLADYNAAFLDQIINISAGMAIISYALYLVTVTSVKNDPSGNRGLLMLSSLPFVIFGVFRYLLLVYKRNEGEAPDKIIFKDRALALNVFIWLVIMIFLHKPS
ncbi:MAG TPA: decaprenyl-phosphate phosphoribosyltransferase [Candidatus Sumerlaeota bacterium]|nr:decaprenyl-phosphate phosphoribosyltransferase [Candidatus Sumerlaeota bacterium]